MGIDVVGKASGLRNGYTRARGSTTKKGLTRPDGRVWMPFGSEVPRTTWADVFIAYNHISKYLFPTTKQCIQLVMEHEKVKEGPALKICSFGPRSKNPRNFSKTKGYEVAKENFLSVSPISKMPGFGFGGFSLLGKMNEIYPFNEEFWGAAQTLAIERSAAGEVPYWSEIAIESVVEAAKELPGNIGEALSKLDPRNLIPDMSPFADILKWGSIGGGLFLLYWYVLKPSKK